MLLPGAFIWKADRHPRNTPFAHQGLVPEVLYFGFKIRVSQKRRGPLGVPCWSLLVVHSFLQEGGGQASDHVVLGISPIFSRRRLTRCCLMSTSGGTLPFTIARSCLVRTSWEIPPSFGARRVTLILPRLATGGSG